MKKTSETVIFFGSGPVAAESLRLLAKDFSIEAVITKPRATHHKGDVPVLSMAKKLKLPVHTATDKKSLDALFAKASFKSRVAILIDFGIIVSQRVINYFPLGIINSHFSLLPQWRGADPISFAILSGQAYSGVSLMLLVAKMDEGPLLATAPHQLRADITTLELTDELIEVSYATLVTIVPAYLSGKVVPIPQDLSLPVSYSRKLTKADGVIDWRKPAEVLEREIRAFNPWPKSHATIADKEVIITSAAVRRQETGDRRQEVGSAVVTPKKELVVVTGKDLLVIERLKVAGKPEMSGVAFLAGHKPTT